MHVLSVVLHTKAIAIVTVAEHWKDIGEKSKFCLNQVPFLLKIIMKVIFEKKKKKSFWTCKGRSGVKHKHLRHLWGTSPAWELYLISRPK